MKVELAIQDPELGPQIQKVRILTPAEIQKVEKVKKIRKLLMQLEQLDEEMAARLEKALDDDSEMDRLAKSYLPPEEYLRMGHWDEDGPKYRELEEASLIKDFVVREYRDDLRGHKITVVFQEKLPPVARRGRLGTMTKLSGKIQFLSGWEAVITLAFEEWVTLTNRDRQRLVHHELEHLDVDEGALCLVGHDFEDFAEIVNLYGFRSQSRRFGIDSAANAIERAYSSQFDLLDPGDPEADSVPVDPEAWDQGTEAWRTEATPEPIAAP